MGASSSDEEVTDSALQDEIELLGDLIAAALGRPHHLSPAEVDLALGLSAAPGQA